jgi:hypothetical protein
MNDVKSVIRAIDQKIQTLNEAKRILLEVAQTPGKIGRPPKVPADPPGNRRLSPAARKRIAAAQKKRWANYRATTKSNGEDTTARV